tara:strand:+ start:595 stop:984 length:390 start_codon:yes stop_codon:yes gene_type:complete
MRLQSKTGFRFTTEQIPTPWKELEKLDITALARWLNEMESTLNDQMGGGVGEAVYRELRNVLEMMALQNQAAKWDENIRITCEWTLALPESQHDSGRHRDPYGSGLRIKYQPWPQQGDPPAYTVHDETE